MSTVAPPEGTEAITPRHARFPLVDAVRALAALSIFGFHAFYHLDQFGNGFSTRLMGSLNVGVPIFFVISGFLLYRPFVSARLTGGTAPPFIPYGIRRVMRIVPAYWVALPIVAIVLGEWYVFRPLGIVRYFGFLQIYNQDTIGKGIGQAWTLCVEVTFYAAIPAIAWVFRRVLPVGDRRTTVRWELLGLAAVYLCSVAWKIGVDRLMGPTDPGYFPASISLPAQLDTFALGMAMAVVVAALAQGAPVPWVVRVVVDRPWVPILLAAGLFLVLGQRVWGFGDNWADHEQIRHQLKALIGVLVLAPAVFGAAEGGLVRRAMGWRPVLWLGLVSYSFYLYHLAAILALKDVRPLADLGWVAVAVAALIVSTLAAWISYRLIETRGIAAGRRWSESWTARVLRR